jgi:hypothetical protein
MEGRRKGGKREKGWGEWKCIEKPVLGMEIWLKRSRGNVSA